jgi:hypothetical protein
MPGNKWEEDMTTSPSRLKVSANRRFLGREVGTLFFYLGDTAWALFHRLSRTDSWAFSPILFMFKEGVFHETGRYYNPLGHRFCPQFT